MIQKIALWLIYNVYLGRLVVSRIFLLALGRSPYDNKLYKSVRKDKENEKEDDVG